VAHVIKRYSNRKLYDPESSRYVTLDDLKQLVRDGAELRVEDAATGEDLTSLTLAQILLEGERTHQKGLPAALLHQLIQHGEAWYELVGRMMRTGPLGSVPGAGDPERLWRQWASFNGWRPPAGEDTAAASAEPTPQAATPLEEEVAALKSQLAALEKRVRPRKRSAGRAPGRPARRPRRRH
jgi:polyhydroxyalkanoate synthesis repressor PhaR